MPNPNYSELELHAKYGHDEDAVPADGQNPKVYEAISDDSDEIDHKFVYAVPIGGLYIELAHYVSVKQVVLQNMSSFNGSMFYIDGTTGALIPDFIQAGEHVSICDPDVTAGIMLYAFDSDPQTEQETDWHLAICGRKD